MDRDRGRRTTGFTSVELPGMSRRGRRAFTLVELLVVVAVIALLVSILLPSLQGALMLAGRAACAANLRNFAPAIGTYVSESDGLMPPSCNYHVIGWTRYIYYEGLASQLAQPPSTGVNRSPDPFFNLGLLWKMHCIDAPPSFYCPGTTEGTQVDKAVRWPYRNGSNQAVTSSSYFFNTFYLPEDAPAWRKEPGYGRFKYKYEINLPGELPLVHDRTEMFDVHANPDVGGWNVLRAYGGRVVHQRGRDVLEGLVPDERERAVLLAMAQRDHAVPKPLTARATTMGGAGEVGACGANEIG